MKTDKIIILALLAVLNFTHILDFMIMMPLGNYLMPKLNINEQQFSILIAAYAISAGVSSFISAFFVNQYDRKLILLLAYFGFLIGTLGCGFSNDYHTLLIARTIAGIFGGLISAQLIAIISDIIPFEKRGMAMGVVMSSFAVASTIGVPLSLKMANITDDWHTPFQAVAAIGLVIWVAVFFGIPSMRQYIQEKSLDRFSVLSTILKDNKQLAALFFSFLMFFGHFIIIPFINPFLEFNMGYSRQETPEIYFYGGAAAFVASFSMGYVADKIGKLVTFMICTFVSLPLVYLVTHLPAWEWSTVTYLFGVWFFFSTGRSVCSQSLISNVSPPEFRGSFQSFNSFVQQIGSGLAALVAGILVDQNTKTHQLIRYENLGYLSIGVLAVSIVFGYFIFKNDEAK